MCCCHCFSLLQFFPHSQQWFPACGETQTPPSLFFLRGSAPPAHSPLPRRSPWACGSACRSPGPSGRCPPRPSRASGTAATARTAAPCLQLKAGGRRVSALAPRRRHRRRNSLLFSFMYVHRSRSSALWAKVQFPTYWHFFPAVTCMQIWGETRGSAAAARPFRTPLRGREYLKLGRDGLFGWQRSDRDPLPPFVGTHQHHPGVSGPPETTGGLVKWGGGEPALAPAPLPPPGLLLRVSGFG